MKIGIDTLAFSTSKYFFRLDALAKHRGVDCAKYCTGIGQSKMSVFPPNEDIVTIAIDAAEKVLAKIAEKSDIDLLIFATESSFDLAKSAGIYLHHFLGLRADCRVFDIKQACYSMTAALQLAKSFVFANPSSKVLIVGADILKYSPRSSGEPTQGGAAVALIVSQNPRTLLLEDHYGIYTTDVMDFWRPIEEKEALFDGKLSAQNYLASLDFTLDMYLKKSDSSISDIDYVCFHTPFAKMAAKACDRTFKNKSVEDSIIYSSIIGNSGSASLYVCIISLLDNSKNDLSNKRLGLFSYGSGSVAEFFSAIVSDGYKNMLDSEKNKKMLAARVEVSFDEYEKFCNNLRDDSRHYENVGAVTMSRIENKQRIYERLF